ncbi:MAG: carbohydrate kinase family protein [Planctomycetota bacterium]|jgi:sugar/nucleoside kinase (ribokinase family)
MARQRVIVGIGESLVRESPAGEDPAGLAVLVPLYAARLGHVGIPISRIGQDETANTLLERLRTLEIDTSHLQTDPDLATGRLIIRSIGGKTVSTLDTRAAFDNLQWDFDLADVAQVADAAVFGALATRGGQTRSVVNRFLTECKTAVRLCDLTNRTGDELDREAVGSTLQGADAVIADRAALEALLPAARGKPTREAALELIRAHGLTFVVIADPSQPLIIHTKEQAWEDAETHATEAHEAAVVGLLHGILAGRDFPACLELASRIARHALAHPCGPVPQELLESG